MSMIEGAYPLRTVVAAALAAAILAFVAPGIGAPAFAGDQTCSCTARHQAMAELREFLLAEKARKADAEEEEEAANAEASQSGDSTTTTAAPEED